MKKSELEHHLKEALTDLGLMTARAERAENALRTVKRATDAALAEPLAWAPSTTSTNPLLIRYNWPTSHG